MNKTVSLVATHEAIERYFPSVTFEHPLSKVVSANFPITPENCKTKLGTWLASRILTTRFDDDASICNVILPATELGLRLKKFGETLSRETQIKSIEHIEQVFQQMEIWIEEQRKVLNVYGPYANPYRVINFQWPVFGSWAASSAATPEAYFDLCAQEIRATGGVILNAGLMREQLPESLARTMATRAGGGNLLLERYRKHFS